MFQCLFRSLIELPNCEHRNCRSFGCVITLKSGGSTTITATQLGNSTYDAATSVTRTLNVQDDSLILKPSHGHNLASLSFGDADLNMTASATSGLAITYTSSDGQWLKW